jgi:DNA polymerase I-like protein with 3'-5' exonuclease and polymerase domains
MQVAETDTVQVGSEVHTIIWWVPGMPVLKEARILGVDTETEYIIKGDPIKPVIAQICDKDRQIVHVVYYTYWKEYFHALYLNNPDAKWVFHNAPFDIHVMGDPRTTITWMLDLLENGRVVDTMIRFKLHELLRGKFNGTAKLDYAAKVLLQITVEKREDIRFTFKQFNADGTPWVPTWDHIRYAAIDAIVTCQLHDFMPDAYPTEDVALLGDIVLNDISNTGMLVDHAVREELLEKHEVEAKSLLQRLDHNHWQPGDGSSKELQKRLAFYEDYYGVTLPRTKGTKAKKEFTDKDGVFHKATKGSPGQIQTTDEAIEAFPDVCPFIINYKRYQKLTKVINTYLKDNPKDELGNEMFTRIGTDGRVHPFFNGMVKTGRTSCSGPNIQNVPRDGGIRTIYKAKPGYVLFACDYSQAELAALAQNCYTRYGHSRMMELINEGYDLHMWLGEKIFLWEGNSQEDWENLPSKKDDDPDFHGKKFYRQLSKALNFGKPGGLAAKTFLTYARGYGVELTLEKAEELLAFWVKSFPEMEEHLQPTGDGNGTVLDKSTGEYETFAAYRGVTITGRIRSKCGYCAACNYSFQGLVADGIKWAMWFLWLDGFRMVNMIHDEVIFELREDDPEIHQKIARIKQVMLHGMRLVLPDMTGLAADGALMRSWRKEAEELIHPVYNHTLIWEDAAAAGWVTDGKLVIPANEEYIKFPPKVA